MKRQYTTPEIQVSLMMGECVLTTDSHGWISGQEALSKENSFIFDDDDNFGDTWGEDTNNLWGDEE